jgi:hypothetical protein
MLTRTGADPIDGADPDRASGSMPRPALGSGGAERGIPTAGIRVGIPAGAPIRGVTTATGTDADAPYSKKRWPSDCAPGQGLMWVVHRGRVNSCILPQLRVGRAPDQGGRGPQVRPGSPRSCKADVNVARI